MLKTAIGQAIDDDEHLPAPLVLGGGHKPPSRRELVEPGLGQRSATRTRQMARGAVARAADPVRAVAAVPSAAMPASRQDPFGHRADTLQARPWPRSSLPGGVSQGAFNASLPAQEGAAAFYPFEPRPPVQDVPATPEPSLLRR